jgi:ATP-dependent Lon protease
VAASRALIPQETSRISPEIPDNVKNALEIIPVKWIDQVFEATLERQPEPLTESEQVAPAPIAPVAEQPAAIKH